MDIATSEALVTKVVVAGSASVERRSLRNPLRAQRTPPGVVGRVESDETVAARTVGGGGKAHVVAIGAGAA